MFVSASALWTFNSFNQPSQIARIEVVFLKRCIIDVFVGSGKNEQNQILSKHIKKKIFKNGKCEFIISIKCITY